MGSWLETKKLSKTKISVNDPRGRSNLRANFQLKMSKTKTKVLQYSEQLCL